MKIVTIVGARPQFVKAAAVSRKLRLRHEEILVHTGQHYDYAMSGVFFDGLAIPAPDVNLGVGSGLHGAQTGGMLQGIEAVLNLHKPEWLLIYGDTNSTLAGALAAAKLHIPIAHVEAGLRSFNRRMPEEINRVVADHLSELLLCPTATAVSNLAAEGITKNVHQVGDVMLDLLNWATQEADAKPRPVLNNLGLERGKYLVATVHRGENTDDPERLSGILNAFNAVSEPVVFPVHPRTRKVIEAGGHKLKGHVRLVEPMGYLDMVTLMRGARLVLTDSGGVQKEAFWLRVPCITLRDETEWVETVQAGWNRLAGTDPGKIMEAVRSFSPPANPASLNGEKPAVGRCIELLEQTLS